MRNTIQIKPRQKVQILPPQYDYLVCSALQEELMAFYELSSSFKKKRHLEEGDVEVAIKIKNRNVKILTYSSAKMGMPYNAAALMKIISKHNPKYTFFIGTCAGLNKKKQKYGDVLIPDCVFSYESGKHTEGNVFLPDHINFETDGEIRRYAEIIKKKFANKFNVFTDENFCSGAAVIDNMEKRDKIINDSPRKVTGLDMEAFAIACINNILKVDKKKLSVVKSIMDFGENKSKSEAKKNKELAKNNSAKFAFELLKYIEENVTQKKSKIKIH